ncbi:hypothetical protein [Pseudovibrio exalbescens]|uniref:SnoaL-like domain-containing protein n=1 Tax=Pseudovibrio exalbescens TaxID=197461 RepID=A0A1U7JF25_9HYPH|nr:hypothetical protein [Pseudovibrio exalbescens]OKL43305.1 hypothetical protein A3843_13845 [Pseudovibrio exalbescens]
MTSSDQQLEDLMKAQALCEEYTHRLERNDLDRLMELFTKEAVVQSPIFDEQRAKDFYTYVLTQITGRSIRIKSIMVSPSNPTRASIHARYNRQVTGSLPQTIDLVNVFRLNPTLDRIEEVTIIYDTAKVRQDFDFPSFPTS